MRQKEATTHDNDISLRLLEGYFSGKSPEQIIETFLFHLKRDHKFNDAQLGALLREAKQEHDTFVPVTLFCDERLAPLEALAKYLHENKHLRFVEIGKLLRRDPRVMWTTYSNAKKKAPGPIVPAPTQYFIPARVIADRRRSVLETLSCELHDKQGLTFAQIARLLNRNDRTIWTAYDRARKKGVAA